MAQFIVPNVIKTPDFASATSARTQQLKKDRQDAEVFRDKFQEKDLIYLEGDKAAVQDAWGDVEKALDLVAENPRSAQAKRDAVAAEGRYAKIAGAAQVRAQNHASQVIAYGQNPSAFGLTKEEYMQKVNADRTAVHDADFIVNDALNPSFILQKDLKYNISDPDSQANKFINSTSNRIKTEYYKDGVLNTEGVTTYIDGHLDKLINANPESAFNAVVFGALKDGLISDYNSIEDKEFLEALPPEEQDKYKNIYKESVRGVVLDRLPKSMSVEKSQLKSFSGYVLPEFNIGDSEETSQGAFIGLPTKVGNIIGIGQTTDGKKIAVRRSENEFEDDAITPLTSYSILSPVEESQIRNKYRDYDFAILNRDLSEKEEPTETTESDINPLGITIPTTESDTTVAENTPVPPLPEGSPESFRQGQGVGQVEAERRRKEQAKDDTKEEKVDEEVEVEAEKEDKTADKKAETTEDTKTESRDYAVINGKVVFRDRYEKEFAGTRSSIGTKYPDTFEEYAERFGETVKNEADDPLQGGELEEATVTSEEIPAGTRTSDDRSIVDTRQEGRQTSDTKQDDSNQEFAQTISPADFVNEGVSLQGDGKNIEGEEFTKTRYVERPYAIPVAPDYVEGGNVPRPATTPNVSNTQATAYYIEDLTDPRRLRKFKKKFEVTDGFKWTPETVKMAMDRSNVDVPVSPEFFIEVSNKFGIPVELILAQAQAESSYGSKKNDRVTRTKNMFNIGNTTEGDKFPAGPEQDKYNKYFESWEDGILAYADLMVRNYRPSDGDWSKLWEKGGKGFVDKEGKRYAAAKNYEKTIRGIIGGSFPRQLTDDYRKAKS